MAGYLLVYIASFYLAGVGGCALELKLELPLNRVIITFFPPPRLFFPILCVLFCLFFCFFVVVFCFLLFFCLYFFVCLFCFCLATWLYFYKIWLNIDLGGNCYFVATI